MYPPIPGGLPRVVPKNGATIAGHFVPEDVCHFHFKPLMWLSLFGKANNL